MFKYCGYTFKMFILRFIQCLVPLDSKSISVNVILRSAAHTVYTWVHAHFYQYISMTFEANIHDLTSYETSVYTNPRSNFKTN